MKKIFISKKLDSSSIFKTKLENAGFEVWGESLLQLELIPFEKIPSVDWIFFYSQNGVQFFFNHIKLLPVTTFKFRFKFININ